MGTRRGDAPGRAQGVGLPAGLTGSGFLHQVLREAVERYPDVLGDARLPVRSSEFRKRYGEALVRFESRRASAPQRSEIASFLVARNQDQLRFEGTDFSGPLREYLSTPAEPARLERIHARGGDGLLPVVPFAGRRWAGGELTELAEHLLQQRRLTRPAAAALDWIARHARGGDRFDLSGHKFVVMGAGAELAPTPLLLAAGASVLWVDVREPTPLLERAEALAGTLTLAPEARDLLREPRRIAATIGAFADGDPVHLGLFAYAPGEGQEWRLAAAMNAIVRSLDPVWVRSVSLFISPTTPLVLQPEEVAAARAHAGERPAWQSALVAARLLASPGPYVYDDVQLSRSVVPLQGLSYQAAQYVSKILAAETYAIYGTRPESEPPRPVTVSANVAGVTATRSMAHPAFQAGFLGARSFRIEIFTPETTRALSGLLMLHDLLDPHAAGSASLAIADRAKRAAGVFAQQVHGGIFALPYDVGSALRIAAVLGLCRRPGLLRKML